MKAAQENKRKHAMIRLENVLKFKLYVCAVTDVLQRRDISEDGENFPLEKTGVIGTDAESDMSLMMTVKCPTLSIKSLPLIRVNVYGMLRGVREEKEIGEKRGRRKTRRKTE